MRYCKINPCDIANGPGVRVSLFVSGCRRHCPGCFNPQTWDFSAGEPFTPEVREHVLELLAKDYIAGLTLLGGEPFEPENQPGVLALVTAVRERLPGKTIWAYTGFRLEELLPGGAGHCESTDALLALVDVLVDGPFELENRDISLAFRGFSNQRAINLKKCRK